MATDDKGPTSPISPVAPIPQIEYRSRVPEFYGFVAWTSTSILFLLYVLWAVLPDEHIIWLGVDWYPSREWSLLLPAYSIVLVLLTYFVYFSLAIAATPAFSDVSAFTDSKALLPPIGVHDSHISYTKGDAIPELYDIPIRTVNWVLYHPE
ncbi:hypothetical protein SERLA73DRAFT_83811 [Serpula lacrymans var. lacrymans S7.3]|uniref:PIG-P domain-containing protein n=2 Tax=Serpula lacrymans var. lacrymans TaxID=341189 RepID=F8PIS3_SERL3|nr:uncharacterized protein SERLADRAFT_413010 [Serpula lacrymans var. lacrymans S7.9]EGO03706.1 hypothetical protein SERLA73DRAFT_83811 [Serpula lacrymans var. lacrymans S7.3]EGO29570.1 hypothetical protein SERLADRAFT_413010 [Serpula lacrymans var. lacrymans S7.9]